MYRTRTLRGAVSGAVAAAAWAIEQPLDKTVLGSAYDDVEILGRAVVRGDGWYPVGLALHLLNGAVFGAIYANVAPAVPLPAVLRGPVAGLTENFASWPLASLADRVHPARKKLPKLAGNRKAFAQATTRHLVFGIARRARAPAQRRARAGPTAGGHRLLEQRPRLARGRDHSRGDGVERGAGGRPGPGHRRAPGGPRGGRLSPRPHEPMRKT